MNAREERTWSVIAHLTALAGLVGLMPLGALIVWLVYKDRSPVVRFHALQALWYQLAWVVILVVYSIVSIIMMLVLIGFFMLLLLPLLALVPVAHGCYAAYRINQGEDYRYPFVGDRVSGVPRSV